MKLLFVSFISNIDWAIGQYLVQTKLSHSQSAAYCHDRCQSGLQSIHSAQQQQQIQDSIGLVPEHIQDTDVFDVFWIGLSLNTSLYDSPFSSSTNNGHFNIQSLGWQWEDHSPFDYGTNITGGIYPWSGGEPADEPTGHNRQCVAVNTSSNLEWIVMDCDIPLPSICGHCNGVINRYAVANVIQINRHQSQLLSGSSHSTHFRLNRSTADSLCSASYGTGASAATVDSRRDFIESKALNVILHSNVSSTWISGRNESPTASVVLCNVVSSLCDDWVSLTSTYKPSASRDSSRCIESIPGNTDILLRNRQWYNGAEPLRIEYLFSVTPETEYGEETDLESGVLIHNGVDGSLCGYYYIAISICTSEHRQDVMLNLYHKETLSNTMNTLSSTALSISQIDTHLLATDYVLSIQIGGDMASGPMFDVSVNDVHHLHFEHSANPNVLSSGYSGPISLRSSSNTQTLPHSLYISGSESMYITSEQDTNCNITANTFANVDVDIIDDIGIDIEEVHSSSHSSTVWLPHHMDLNAILWVIICSALILASCGIVLAIVILSIVHRRTESMQDVLKETVSQLTNLKVPDHERPRADSDPRPHRDTDSSRQRSPVSVPIQSENGSISKLDDTVYRITIG